MSSSVITWAPKLAMPEAIDFTFQFIVFAKLILVASLANETNESK